jgi:hypothetical protein
MIDPRKRAFADENDESRWNEKSRRGGGQGGFRFTEEKQP